MVISTLHAGTVSAIPYSSTGLCDYPTSSPNNLKRQSTGTDNFLSPDVLCHINLTKRSILKPPSESKADDPTLNLDEIWENLPFDRRRELYKKFAEAVQNGQRGPESGASPETMAMWHSLHSLLPSDRKVHFGPDTIHVIGDLGEEPTQGWLPSWLSSLFYKSLPKE
ncbi:hypothetical protein BC835DRAFT_1305984 [Cytidiella melzeri]|nr:hypothetical protein BC835DRAFT_1305984 [Cytidiella melzeri]